MADASKQAQPNKKRQRPRPTRDFDEIVRQADAKAIKLFDLINDQTKHQFEFAIQLHRILVFAALTVLVISVIIVLFVPTANTFVQTFSLIGTPVSLLALLIAYLRNPVAQQRQTFEHLFRLNVTFLNFLHRTQNSKILVEETLARTQDETIDKVQVYMDDYENVGEGALGVYKDE